MPGIDLHTHTNRSDGTFAPAELVRRAAGLGLEVDHTDHSPEQRERYRDLATRLGLIPTGGSDCHGTRYDPIRLGTSVCHPDSYDALRARADR